MVRDPTVGPLCCTRTRPAGVSEVYNVGRYIDSLVRIDGALKLRSRLAVYDSEMVLNSLIYPV